MSTVSQIFRRRALMAEGRILVGSILGGPPGSGAIRRYVAGAERFQDGVPLSLPWVVRRCPALIRAFEPVGARDSRRGHRLALALRVAEATPRGAALTHPAGAGLVPTLIRLIAIVATETALMPLRLLLGRRWGGRGE
jgi:hypothetical protein